MPINHQPALTAYLTSLQTIHDSGRATDERSYYPALAALFDAVGVTLSPRVVALHDVTDRGTGHPDFLLQVETTKDIRAAVEAKGTAPELDAIITSEQVRRYLTHHDPTLVTNLREFALVRLTRSKTPEVIMRHSFAPNEAAFWLASATTLARDHAERFGDFLVTAMTWDAVVKRPIDLAEALARYAREALRRLEAQPAENLAGLRHALSDALGLLTNSFRPDGEMCALRAYLRHRANLAQQRAVHIQQMQKAFQQMNIQLTQVISNITGDTGMAIVRAIVAGERDGVKLAQFRDRRCKSSEETIAKALKGTWKDEHLFTLKQSLALYDFYTQQISACDAQIQQHYRAMKPRWECSEVPATPLPPKKRYKSGPPDDTRAELIRITGVDIAAMVGIGVGLAQTILSEIGTDMSQWPTEKHFASWCGVAPHNDISGGKVLRSRTLPTRNRAGQAFRQAATAVNHSPSAFGAFYRRKRSKGGPLYAQVATANKIARTVYHLLKYHVPYEDVGAEEFERQHRERDIAVLRKKATKLGFTLVAPELDQPVA